MKNFSFLFFIAVIISSCNQSVKRLQQNIADTDSVAINYFKGDGTMDTVIAVKILKDKKSIEELTGFIAGSAASVKSDFGYDGSIHFFKNDRVIQDVFFNSNKEECRQFVFISDGQKEATSLKIEAKEFLSAIKNK